MEIGVRLNPPLQKRQRVAAYCRVSTDNQENSLENQKQHYEEEISSNPSYEFAGLFYDFGISGFKGDRKGFKKLMDAARNGEVDLIITKSISRFARNALTLITAVRELKEKGIGVFFELQNINTLTAEGEVMMTIYAAFAQAESEGISEVGKMAYQRKYEAGIPVQYLERSFGYRKDDDGNIAIDEDEAKWVRLIYHMISNGYTAAAVKRHLNDNGVKTVKGTKWQEGTVINIVKNEIYKGDYIMHKHFVDDNRRLVPNRGEVTSWYVAEDHVPIVSASLWEKAQEALKERRRYLDEGSEIDGCYTYADKLFCAECGHKLYPRIYSNGNRLNWCCTGTKRYGKKFCPGVNVPDSTISGWKIDGNIYVYEKPEDRGLREHGFYRESYWKRGHKKRLPQRKAPALTTENYPYMDKIYCGFCGCKLTRHINTLSGDITWVCSGKKRNGRSFCEGVRIPDCEVRKWIPIVEDIYIKSGRDGNGKKCYSYTSKNSNPDI